MKPSERRAFFVIDTERVVNYTKNALDTSSARTPISWGCLLMEVSKGSSCSTTGNLLSSLGNIQMVSLLNLQHKLCRAKLRKKN